MGGNLSNMESARTSSSNSSSHVRTFHTTDKWNNHFNACKQTDKLMVIEFTASWCGPCKYMNPIIQKLAAKYDKVDFVEIDVDELTDVTRKFKVQAMPTFILMKKGEIVDTVVGAKTEELQKRIEQHQN